MYDFKRQFNSFKPMFISNLQKKVEKPPVAKVEEKKKAIQPPKDIKDLIDAVGSLEVKGETEKENEELKMYARNPTVAKTLKAMRESIAQATAEVCCCVHSHFSTNLLLPLLLSSISTL